jgi:hypothetical protein
MKQVTMGTAKDSNSSVIIEIRYTLYSRQGTRLAEVIATGQPQQQSQVRLNQLVLQSPHTGQIIDLPLSGHCVRGGDNKVIDADYRVL